MATLVSSVATSLRPQTASKLVLAVISADGQRCYERFVFDIRLPQLEGGEDDAAALSLSPALQAQLADALSKLSLCNSLLTALPLPQSPAEALTFTLLLYTNAELAAPPQPPPPPAAASAAVRWLPVELSGCSAPPAPSRPWLLEIRSVRSPQLECEMYVCEADDKAAYTQAV